MASLTRWTWVWVNSGNWWWTGRPGVLRFMGSQRVGHDWATELNWTELYSMSCGKPEWKRICKKKKRISLCVQLGLVLMGRVMLSKYLIFKFPPQSVSPIRKLPFTSDPYPSESQQNENHNHRKLIKLIKWITALSNSMKIWAVLCRAIQDGQVMVESSDKMWSTGEGNGKLLQYSCLENPMNNMKRQKDMTLKDELPRSVGDQYVTGEEWRNNPRKKEGWSQSQNNAQLWIWLVMEVKSDDVKNNIA